MAIAANCKSLLIENLTDESIKAIAASCPPTLTSLQLNSCRFLTGEAIKAVAAKCSKLRELGV